MKKQNNKLFESLPRQSTVDQLHKIRDEIKKSQKIKVGPEEIIMSGDIGDRVINDLIKHKGKQEMNNLFWWDNPTDRYICSYEDYVKNDSRDSLGYTPDGDPKSHKGTDFVKEKLNESDLYKKKKDMENLKTFEEFNLFGKKKELSPDEEYKRQELLHKKEEKRLRKKKYSVKDYGEDNYNEKEEEMVKKGNASAKINRIGMDPYGEESW